MSRRSAGPPPTEAAEEAPPPDPPSGSGTLPPWLRYLTHLVALGWGTAEQALFGGRPGSYAFIALVLVGSEGSRLVGKVHRALQS